MVPLVNFIVEHYMHEQGYLPRELIIINYLLDFSIFLHLQIRDRLQQRIGMIFPATEDRNQPKVMPME